MEFMFEMVLVKLILLVQATCLAILLRNAARSPINEWFLQVLCSYVYMGIAEVFFSAISQVVFSQEDTVSIY